MSFVVFYARLYCYVLILAGNKRLTLKNNLFDAEVLGEENGKEEMRKTICKLREDLLGMTLKYLE